MARRRRKKKFSVIKSLNEVNHKVNQGTHFPVIMLTIIIIAGLMIGFVWQKVKMNQLVADVDALKKQQQTLLQYNEQERARLLNLMNDSRIISIAQEKLGLTFPQYEVVVLPYDMKKKEELIAKIMVRNLK